MGDCLFWVCFLEDFYYADEAVNAGFYVEADGVCFPGEGWTDFVVSVLDMWISNIMTCHGCERANFKLFFMDGPYFIECSKVGDAVHMRCIENRWELIVVCEMDVLFADLVREITGITGVVIEAIERQEFGVVRYLDDLKANFERLRLLS